MIDDDLETLFSQFLDRTLPKAQWTHEAHLQVGLLLARRTPSPDLLATLRQEINAYNASVGDLNTDEAGYHETITAFYAKVLEAFARATADLPVSEASRLLLTSPLAGRRIVRRAYADATLQTREARRGVMPPDRSDFNADRLAREALSTAQLVIRLAEPEDAETLRLLIDDAIGHLLRRFMSPQMVEGSREFMGLDTQLIADRTYYVVCSGDEIVGCGGWSRRATLFGGDHTGGRDAALLDPAVDPARVRAMYTRPGWTRRGIGKTVLATCEAAAAAEDFGTCELASTLAGEPLYLACGYQPVEAIEARTREGLNIPLIRMRKLITTAT
jgi:GNAT superfamily N-acetyltransferase